MCMSEVQFLHVTYKAAPLPALVGSSAHLMATQREGAYEWGGLFLTVGGIIYFLCWREYERYA